MASLYKSRNRTTHEARLVGGSHWEKRDAQNLLFVTNDTVLAKEFATFAKRSGANVHYLWSLEGLDFLPLPNISIAIITSDRWYDHEIFGRPVNKTLQSFPRILVILKDGENPPGGKVKQENVEYVKSVDEMYAALNDAFTHHDREPRPGDAYLPQ